MNEKAPGETLLDLYTDITRIRLLSAQKVTDPNGAMEQAVQAYGVEIGGISELTEAELAKVGREGLRAYFAKKDQLQAEQNLRERQSDVIRALSDFIYSHRKDDARITQTADTGTPLISVYARKKPVRSAIGRITMPAFPYALLNFERRLWLGRHDIVGSNAEVFRGNSLKPRVAVEFL